MCFGIASIIWGSVSKILRLQMYSLIRRYRNIFFISSFVWV